MMREAARWLHARSMPTRSRSPLLASRMSRWHSGLDRDYNMVLGADLVLRVIDSLRKA